MNVYMLKRGYQYEGFDVYGIFAEKPSKGRVEEAIGITLNDTQWKHIDTTGYAEVGYGYVELEEVEVQ